MVRGVTTIQILLVLSLNIAQAQENYVVNGSFELYTQCPTLQNLKFNLNLAPSWYNPTENTPDYYNACDTLHDESGVPENWQGFQNARTGKAYAGFGTQYGSTNGREYIGTKLLTPLELGKQYQLEYYASLSNYSSAAIGGIGAFFSIDSVRGDTAEYGVLNIVPQIEHPWNNFLKDTLNWMRVTGSFIAQGGERYMTIGNFRDDAHTILDTFYFVPYNWYFAYYYIDDVSLTEVPPLQEGPLPILPLDTMVQPVQPLIIPSLLGAATPTWQVINLHPQTKVTLYNLIGQLLYQSLNYQNDLPVSWLAAGVYCYVIQEPGGKTDRGKLIVMR